MKSCYKYAMTTALLFLVSFGIKVYLSHEEIEVHGWNTETFYPSEATLQFYWSGIVQENGALPSKDSRIQFPEGLKHWIDTTPVLEYICGNSPLLSRFRTQNPIVYSILWIAFLSSLPILIAGYFAYSQRLDLVTLSLCLSVYLLHPFSYLRVIGNFGRENLSYTFIFAVFVLTLIILSRKAASESSEWKPRDWAEPALAAFFQWLAFSSWHMSRPFYLLLLGWISFILILGVHSPLKVRKLTLFLILTIPSYLVLPVLSSRVFALSPAAVMSYALIIWTLLPQAVRANTWLCVAILTTPLWFALFLTDRADSHVSSIVADKLRFFLRKPADPQELNPETRLMWVEAFHSPRLSQLIAYILVPLLLICFLLKGKVSELTSIHKSNKIVLYSALMLLLAVFGFVLFFRLHGYLNFIFCIYLVGTLKALVPTRNLQLLCLLIYALYTVLLQSPLKSMIDEAVGLPQHGVTFFRQSHMDLLQWMQDNQEFQGVYAAGIGTSAMIYAYGNQTTILQPKFENPDVRDKTIKFLKALHQKESDLLSFCKEYSVEYVLYESNWLLDSSKDSLSYTAGYPEAGIDSVIYQMHFKPTELFDFELVYQNANYRVFRRMEPDDMYINESIGWEPVYEASYFNIDYGESIEPEDVIKAKKRIDTLYSLFSTALKELQSGNIEQAYQFLQRVVDVEPRFYKAWIRLGEIAEATGQPAVAIQNYEKALTHSPELPKLEQKLERLKALRESDEIQE